ncbi:MAG: hypothetical protein ACOYXM_16705 [Actinomycetota bacterium]
MGIETYEAALTGEKAVKGEREAAATLIEGDEVLIRRFWGFKLDDESGTVAEYGVALIVTDRQLLMLKEGGLLKKKFKTWAVRYEQLKENIARSEFSAVPGSKPYYLTGFARLRADTACMATFFEERDRDAFAAVLQAAIDAQRNGHTMSASDLEQARSLLR